MNVDLRIYCVKKGRWKKKNKINKVRNISESDKSCHEPWQSSPNFRRICTVRHNSTAFQLPFVSSFLSRSPFLRLSLRALLRPTKSKALSDKIHVKLYIYIQISFLFTNSIYAIHLPFFSRNNSLAGKLKAKGKFYIYVHTGISKRVKKRKERYDGI